MDTKPGLWEPFVLHDKTLESPHPPCWGVRVEVFLKNVLQSQGTSHLPQYGALRSIKPPEEARLVRPDSHLGAFSARQAAQGDPPCALSPGGQALTLLTVGNERSAGQHLPQHELQHGQRAAEDPAQNGDAEQEVILEEKGPGLSSSPARLEQIICKP